MHRYLLADPEAHRDLFWSSALQTEWDEAVIADVGKDISVDSLAQTCGCDDG